MVSDAKIGEVKGSLAGWLQPHRRQFLQDLIAEGYGRLSLWRYDRGILGFCAVVERRGLSSGDLVGRSLERVRQTTVEQFEPKLHADIRFRVSRFINYLAEAGVATLPKRRQKATTALERLRQEYEAYLRHQRGLSDATIKKSLEFLKRFMTFRFGGRLGDLNSITPDDVVAFLREVRARTQPYRDKTPPTHLRNLFRFMFWTGKTKCDLANAIPRVAMPPQSHLPRHLNSKAIEQIIDATWSGDPVGLRNYAMILLTARLGLRGPEVIAIQLDDIDWRAGTILIRGKGKRYESMPLPKDVGRAIVEYIRKGRRGSSRTLFVSSKVPYPPFVDARILNTALHDALKRTGLNPPQKYVGSHLLRHSLATDMLRKGASLDEIGDVLRHRSRLSTTIYASHDVEGLRSIARAWPVDGGCA